MYTIKHVTCNPMETDIQGSHRCSKVCATVLLPAPFGPRMAQRSPASTFTLRSFTKIRGGGPASLVFWEATAIATSSFLP